MNKNWMNMTSEQFESVPNTENTAILPIGAVEAHGPHLPIGTDIILAEHFAKKISERIGGVILPSLPFGQVWSLKNFSGSVHVPNERLIPFVEAIGESVFAQGFTRFIIVNGHLGNQNALKEVSRKLYETEKSREVYALFYPGLYDSAKDVIETKSQHKLFFHADEIETSLMLYLAEDNVDMSKAITDIPDIPADIDYTPVPWENFTNTAVLGDAARATKEKGKYIIENSLKEIEKMFEASP